MQHAAPLNSKCMGQTFAAKFADQPVVICHNGPVHIMFWETQTNFLSPRLSAE